MKKWFIAVGMSIFWTGWSPAQEPEHLWTMEECMEYAVRNSPKARKQTYTNKNYRQDYIAALGSMLPSVNGSSQANWDFGTTNDDHQHRSTTEFSNSYSLSTSIPLFNGFTRINRLRSARIAGLRGTEELQKIEDEIALLTMEAYVNVVYCTEALRIAGEQLDASRNNLYNTRKQEELGLKGRPDIAQFEAEVAAYEYTVTRQKNLLNSALLNLKDQMNYPFEDPLPIRQDIPVHSGIFRENALEIFLDARDRLPQARISDHQLRETELSLSIARGQYYPSLSASGNISSQYFKQLKPHESASSFFGQLDDKIGKGIRVSMSIPVFNGLSQRARVSQARNNLRIAEETHDENMRELQRTIEQAVMDVEGYAKEYAQAIKKVTATEEAHRANQRRFDEGLISVLELQNSTNLLLEARVQKLNVELQYRIKCKLLDYYKGEPLIGQW